MSERKKKREKRTEIKLVPAGEVRDPKNSFNKIKDDTLQNLRIGFRSRAPRIQLI